MAFNLLDNPLILSLAFYPRPASPSDGIRAYAPGVHSGTIPVAEDVVVGYRLHVLAPDAPVILYFHGNAEIASDYDFAAPVYHRQVGASLMVVDFRGFGWSTGSPTFSALINDGAPVVAALPGILAAAGVADSSPHYVMGRSMGSAPAMHIAHTHPEQFRGVIIESGFADVLTVLVRIGLPGAAIGNLVDPLGNERKAHTLKIPFLVIHGENDNLIPVNHAQRLYDAVPGDAKRIVRIPGAGHNDLMMVGADAYYGAIADFVQG